MSFGPISPRTLIFRKTKLWWELFSKLHLPDLRIELSSRELSTIAKQTQILEEEIKHLQMKASIDLEEMIDFKRLKKAFFREKKFMYGVPVKES